jgi:ech hydrogenase subunit E
MARVVVPFGPQHPVLPEPVHLTLICEEDLVKQAIPAIGYCHRGIEKLAEQKPFQQVPFLVERICGICNFMHAMAYCQAVEKILKLEVPPRAKYLRVIWAELNRMRSHLLYLGLAADAIGFESVFMQFWRVRERVIDLIEETTGARIILSTNIIGGVRRDISQELLIKIDKVLNEIKPEIAELGHVLLNDYSIKMRTKEKGVLSKDDAHKLGAVGPTARGSGINKDNRTIGYAAYGELDFNPIVEQDGDAYARTLVRYKETLQAMDLIHQAIKKLPGGEIAKQIDAWPNGEAFEIVEQPRGEVFYYVKGNGTINLERMRVRTPTFSNIPSLLHMLEGCHVEDVPIITLSIDPCISCTER